MSYKVPDNLPAVISHLLDEHEFVYDGLSADGQTYDLCEVERDFSALKAEDLGGAEPEEVFSLELRNTTGSSNDDSDISRLLVQAAAGELYSMRIDYPRFWSSKFDASMSIKIVEDTPANREQLVLAHCKTAASAIEEYVHALQKHAPGALTDILASGFPDLSHSERLAFSRAMKPLINASPSRPGVEPSGPGL